MKTCHLKRLTEPARIYIQHIGITKNTGLAGNKLKFNETNETLIDICPVKCSALVEWRGRVISVNSHQANSQARLGIKFQSRFTRR